MFRSVCTTAVISISMLVMTGLVMTGASAPVVAAEAFLCGPDEVIYVEVADLERMKRTNACIAAHYGLEIEPAQNAPKANPANGVKPQVKSKPATAAATAPAAKSDTARSLKFRPLTEAPVKVAKPVALATLNKRSVEPAVPSVGTDYRNVRVLNAQSDADAWYHHAR